MSAKHWRDVEFHHISMDGVTARPIEPRPIDRLAAAFPPETPFKFYIGETVVHEHPSPAPPPPQACSDAGHLVTNDSEETHDPLAVFLRAHAPAYAVESLLEMLRQPGSQGWALFDLGRRWQEQHGCQRPHVPENGAPSTREVLVAGSRAHVVAGEEPAEQLRARRAVAHPQARVDGYSVRDAPARGTIGGVEVVVAVFLDGRDVADLEHDVGDAGGSSDRMIAEVARRVTGLAEPREVAAAVARGHVAKVEDVGRALGIADGERLPPEVIEILDGAALRASVKKDLAVGWKR